MAPVAGERQRGHGGRVPRDLRDSPWSQKLSWQGDLQGFLVYRFKGFSQVCCRAVGFRAGCGSCWNAVGGCATWHSRFLLLPSQTYTTPSPPASYSMLQSQNCHTWLPTSQQPGAFFKSTAFRGSLWLIYQGRERH